jgi:hypothetical protein
VLEQALMAERALARGWELASALVPERGLAQQAAVAPRRVLQAWEWAGAPPSAWLCRSALALARQAREDAPDQPLRGCPRAAR